VALPAAAPGIVCEAFKVVLHDLKLYRKPLPPGKFNHAQRIAYTSVS
jgi:hypothetical protein